MADLNGKLEGGLRMRGTRPAEVPGTPLVSIVTVVYNGAATLDRTIQSVLAQDHPSIEYIIVDGASKDGTLDIIRRYEDRLAYWVSAKDKGIYDAMNKGIALCTGAWVGMINADDWYAEGAVSNVMRAAIGGENVNIMHGDIWIHYPNGSQRIKRAKRSGFLLRHWEMVLNHPSFFVRRSYYAGHTFDPTLRVSGDHQWTLRAWLEDPAQFRYVAEPIAHFTAGGASMSIPLGKALAEGARVSRSVGMGPFGVLMGHVVRTALYVPQSLKLLANQYLGRNKDQCDRSMVSVWNIFQDLRANKGNPKGMLVMVMFRIAHLLRRSPISFILFLPYFIFYRVAVEWILCIELPWKTRIGPGFRIDHGQALVVNDHTVFGAGCTVRNSTTIGNRRLPDGTYSASPRFGDRVDIGANAVIIGPITIGDDAAIGAGAVVVKDVPAGHVAVGNPSRIIRRRS